MPYWAHAQPYDVATDQNEPMILRVLKSLFHWFVALLILFEDWGWEPLGRLVARLGRLPVVASLERRVQSLPPYGALAVFFLPTIALLPVKIAALWLIAHGQHVLGVTVILAAKVGGTAILARLFALTRPALMQLAWFARFYTRWSGWKAMVVARVRASTAWLAIGRAKAAARAVADKIRSLLR